VNRGACGSRKSVRDYNLPMSLPGQTLDIRLLVDRIPAFTWSTHPDGSVEFVNQRWREYAGLSAEESQGWGWQTYFNWQAKYGGVSVSELKRMKELEVENAKNSGAGSRHRQRARPADHEPVPRPASLRGYCARTTQSCTESTSLTGNPFAFAH
jgi:PAS domain-containing protein